MGWAQTHVRGYELEDLRWLKVFGVPGGSGAALGYLVELWAWPRGRHRGFGIVSSIDQRVPCLARMLQARL